MEQKQLAVAYCRVSTEEQANKGLSIEVQEENCTRAILEGGLRVFKVIKDEGKSAGTLKRPGMEELIKLVIAQKIGVIYVVASDRLARNTMDHLYLRDMFRKNNVELKYLNQPSMDNSALSLTMDTVMASFNELQRLNTSEKVKKTLYAKAEAGYFPTVAPIGYKNVINPSAENRLSQKMIAPDEMAPFVTEAFKLYATGNFNGYDLNEVLYKKGLRAKSGGKIPPSRFYELLKNRIYIGEIHWGEIHVKHGKHEPLVDEDVFNQVQTITMGHNHHACRRRKYSWLLNGFVYCAEHQKRYTAEWHLNKKIAYYHCSNRFGCGRYIEIGELEDKISEKFEDLEFNPVFVEMVITKTKEIFYKRRKDYEQKKQGLINRRTAFEAKRKVAEDKLLSAVMSDEEFTRARGELNKEIALIEEALMELESRQNVKVDIAQEILRFTGDTYSAYKIATPAVKRLYLSFFWERFEIADGVIIKSTPSLLFRELLALQQVFEKNKNPKKQHYSLESSQVILRPNLLPG